jgi:hypothetical protein
MIRRLAALRAVPVDRVRGLAFDALAVIAQASPTSPQPPKKTPCH